MTVEEANQNARLTTGFLGAQASSLAVEGRARRTRIVEALAHRSRRAAGREAAIAAKCAEVDLGGASSESSRGSALPGRLFDASRLVQNRCAQARLDSPRGRCCAQLDTPRVGPSSSTKGLKRSPWGSTLAPASSLWPFLHENDRSAPQSSIVLLPCLRVSSPVRGTPTMLGRLGCVCVYHPPAPCSRPTALGSLASLGPSHRQQPAYR
jgi:hypothetical protein